MTEVAVNRPTYQEFVKNFSWEDLLARTDWPMHEKFNLGYEICDRWANDPAKADQPALRYELKDGRQGSFTYRQLRDMSNQFANVLAGLGIKKGDRIGGLLSKKSGYSSHAHRYLEAGRGVCTALYRFCCPSSGLSPAS